MRNWLLNKLLPGLNQKWEEHNNRDIMGIEQLAENEINKRSNNAKQLAKRFKDLRGLSFKEMLEKLPLDLDFITASELYEELNIKVDVKTN